ncbi:MAG: hypothetical protein M1829_000283 [Trizodia sp. TS-e1964]|nr:MAG: hypothetical protein M1829_000283 [Trizodia sp. TS-e1964]
MRFIDTFSLLFIGGITASLPLGNVDMECCQKSSVVAGQNNFLSNRGIIPNGFGHQPLNVIRASPSRGPKPLDIHVIMSLTWWQLESSCNLINRAYEREISSRDPPEPEIHKLSMLIVQQIRACQKDISASPVPQDDTAVANPAEAGKLHYLLEQLRRYVAERGRMSAENPLDLPKYRDFLMTFYPKDTKGGFALLDQRPTLRGTSRPIIARKALRPNSYPRKRVSSKEINLHSIQSLNNFQLSQLKIELGNTQIEDLGESDISVKLLVGKLDLQTESTKKDMTTRRLANKNLLDLERALMTESQASVIRDTLMELRDHLERSYQVESLPGFGLLFSKLVKGGFHVGTQKPTLSPRTNEDSNAPEGPASSEKFTPNLIISLNPSQLTQLMLLLNRARKEDFTDKGFQVVLLDRRITQLEYQVQYAVESYTEAFRSRKRAQMEPRQARAICASLVGLRKYLDELSLANPHRFELHAFRNFFTHFDVKDLSGNS